MIIDVDSDLVAQCGVIDGCEAEQHMAIAFSNEGEEPQGFIVFRNPIEIRIMINLLEKAENNFFSIIEEGKIHNLNKMLEDGKNE